MMMTRKHILAAAALIGSFAAAATAHADQIYTFTDKGGAGFSIQNVNNTFLDGPNGQTINLQKGKNPPYNFSGTLTLDNTTHTGTYDGSYKLKDGDTVKYQIDFSYKGNFNPSSLSKFNSSDLINLTFNPTQKADSYVEVLGKDGKVIDKYNLLLKGNKQSNGLVEPSQLQISHYKWGDLIKTDLSFQDPKLKTLGQSYGNGTLGQSYGDCTTPGTCVSTSNSTSGNCEVPEPASVALFGLGVMGLAFARFRASLKATKA